MKREYLGREIELLAPAGTFADFQAVIKSAANAVYFGGKKFNMRMHNPNHNLSNEEIVAAVQIAHELDKKVYVTFNNMMTDAELSEAEEFLRFLAQSGVDALIIQDLGAVQLIRQLGLELELHLSIMANVHNEEMIAAASELGVTRCVISREASLNQVRQFADAYPQMEYEYFIHGDMCIAHGAQCYASGVFFGKSGNRGLCMKPCRWGFQDADETIYPLAVKDMSLYQHIPELIQSGVNSYKIEGRMRSSEYLLSVINLYGEAIDRFLTDPVGYRLDQTQVNYLEENRVRDLSTAYALHKPGMTNIAIDGKREPRVFSQPQEEPGVRPRRVEKLVAQWQKLAPKPQLAELRVTVDSETAALSALAEGVDSLYLSGEVLAPNQPFSKASIARITAVAAQSETPVFYSLPRMTTKEQLARLDHLINALPELGVTGILCSNLGEIHRYQHLDLELRGDYGLNVYNGYSSAFYKEQGLTSVTFSLEAPSTVLAAASEINTPVEVIVQGNPTLMYMEHSFKKAQAERTADDWNSEESGNLDLTDIKGLTRKIREDQYGKNHLLPTKDFHYAVIVPELGHAVAAVRIEGKEYDEPTLRRLIQLYRQALQSTPTMDERLAWAQIAAEATGHEQSLQSLVFDA